MKIIKNSTVRGSESDASANLSVIGVFQIVQDCVTEILGKYEIDGVSLLRKYNAFWVFSKNGVRLIKPIAWSEAYTAEVFISDYSLARVFVDVAIKDGAGELAAYARVELCALDAATFRIRKTSTVGMDSRIVCEAAEYGITNETPSENGLSLVERITVRSSNIDLNNHTNNVEYLRFVLDTYSVAQIKARPIAGVDVCYVNQSYEGDVLEVCKRSDGDSDTVALFKDGTVIFKCKLSF